MQDDRIALNLQNSQSNRSLMIALLAVVVAAGGAGSTAYFNMRSAHLQIEAHTTAATMQIESQERLLKLQLASQKDPVINVTVEMPSEKNIPRVKQSIHPKTTHDLKPQQP